MDIVNFNSDYIVNNTLNTIQYNIFKNNPDQTIQFLTGAYTTHLINYLIFNVNDGDLFIINIHYFLVLFYYYLSFQL